MSVRAIVYNKAGEYFHTERACFGFLAGIHFWDYEMFDDLRKCSEDIANEYRELESKGNDDDEYYLEQKIHRFDSSDLDHLVYEAACYLDAEEMLKHLPTILKGLPQFYSGCKLLDYDPKDPHTIRFDMDLKHESMQVPVMGLMMLRNVCYYNDNRRTFLRLVEIGVEPVLAFLLAQSVLNWVSGLGKSNKIYRYYLMSSSDATIFASAATVADIANIYTGGLGNIWQKHFGDTDNGYGRYGSYGDGPAPLSPRMTDLPLNLIDTMLHPSIVPSEENPYLHTAVKGFGYRRSSADDCTEEYFLKQFVPRVLQAIEDWKCQSLTS